MKRELHILLTEMYKPEMTLQALLKYFRDGTKVIIMPKFEPANFKKTILANRVSENMS